jgi:hypothetical protein
MSLCILGLFDPIFHHSVFHHSTILYCIFSTSTQGDAELKAVRRVHVCLIDETSVLHFQPINDIGLNNIEGLLVGQVNFDRPVEVLSDQL